MGWEYAKGRRLAVVLAMMWACAHSAPLAAAAAPAELETYEDWSCRELPNCVTKAKTKEDIMCEVLHECTGVTPARYATDDERIDARLGRFAEEWDYCQQEMRAMLKRVNDRVLWLHPAVEDKLEFVFINDWAAMAYSDPRTLKIYVSAGLCHQLFATAAAIQSYSANGDDAAAEQYVLSVRSAIEKLAKTVPYGSRSLDIDFHRIDSRAGFNRINRSEYVVPSLLYIVAHETGHLALKHQVPGTPDEAWRNEYAADKFAYGAMKRAEYTRASEPTIGATMAFLNSAPALFSPGGAPLARHPPNQCRLFSTLQYSGLFKAMLADAGKDSDDEMQVLIAVAKKGTEISWAQCEALLQMRDRVERTK